MKKYEFTESDLDLIVQKLGEMPYKYAVSIITLLKQLAKEVTEDKKTE